jgi:uncharacterized membrane protein YphA (DoxX/SURF4 family)
MALSRLSRLSRLTRLSRLSRLGVSWLLGAWFCHLFVTMGRPKFRSDSFWTALFAHWGYPPSFRILIGAIEVTAGVALLVPWVTSYAAMALILVMLGAAGSLATDARWHDVLTVTIYAVGLTWIGWEWRGRRYRKGVGSKVL